MVAVFEGYGPTQTRPYGCGINYLKKGRGLTLVVDGSEPGVVAVFEGTTPAPTRPYGYNNDYLAIIWRAWNILAGRFSTG